MAPLRMDHVTVVVEDLDGAIAFFVELGMELEGRAVVAGPWVDQISGLDDVEAEIAMVRTPDGHNQIELTHYRTPPATTSEPSAPPNTIGYRQVMFQVDDLDDTLARLRAIGAELIGELVQYGEDYRLAYLRGPEGLIVALAEQLG